jgi:hypothetical protein
MGASYNYNFVNSSVFEGPLVTKPLFLFVNTFLKLNFEFLKNISIKRVNFHIF